MGGFTDEAFGVFVLSSNTQEVHLTLDIFPTERMHDFEVTLEEVSPTLLVISRKGATYGDGAGQTKYFFDLSKKKLIRKISHSGTRFSGLVTFQGTLYFLATDTYRKDSSPCLKDPESCYVTKSLILQLKSPKRYREAEAYQSLTPSATRKFGKCNASGLRDRSSSWRDPNTN